MKAHTAQWFILVLINIPVFLALGRLLFDNWGDFLHVLRLWLRADWYRNLQSQWQEEPWFTAKLPLFVGVCVLLVVLEYLMFGRSSIKHAGELVSLL